MNFVHLGGTGMNLVEVIVCLALVQFLRIGFAVGRAREKYGVKAPATTGNEVFERYFRVQMNTLEQLIVFIPSIFLFAQYVEPRIAAILGFLFLAGRAWYFAQYVRDPAKRSAAFALAFLPMVVLLAGAIIGIALQMFRQ
jgi:hypothetical protein